MSGLEPTKAVKFLLKLYNTFRFLVGWLIRNSNYQNNFKNREFSIIICAHNYPWCSNVRDNRSK